MVKMHLFGTNVDVLEHMKEIKEKSSLFNRFFNKKQMFNFFFGKYVFKDNYDHTEGLYNLKDYPSEFGKVVGAYTCICYAGSNNVSIAFHKVEDINKDMYEDVIDSLEWDSMLVKDDNGQVYFIEINED